MAPLETTDRSHEAAHSPSFGRRFARTSSAFVVVAALVGFAVWGHRSDWRFAARSTSHATPTTTELLKLVAKTELASAPSTDCPCAPIARHPLRKSQVLHQRKRRIERRR